MWPELNPRSSDLAFAAVRCFSRRLPQTSPGVATSCIVSVDPTDPTPHRYSPAETFSGAACYLALDSATIFRAIMPAVAAVKSGSPSGIDGSVIAPLESISSLRSRTFSRNEGDDKDDNEIPSP